MFFFKTFVDETKLDPQHYTVKASVPVYISMTTIPSRLDNAFKIIKHFLEHIQGIEKFILNIPLRYHRWPDFDASTINHSIKDKRFILNRCEDYGPLTKLLPAIELIPNNSILIVRDDMCYQTSAFVDITKLQDGNRNEGFSFYVYDYNGVPVPQGADLISMYGSTIRGFPDWYKEFISKNGIKQYNDSDCFFVDDQVIGWYFKIAGIPMTQVESRHRMIYVLGCEFSDITQNLNRQTGERSRENVMKKCYDEIKKTI